MYITLLRRMIHGCKITSAMAFVPSHQKMRLSLTDMPINTHQATKVATEIATVIA